MKFILIGAGLAAVIVWLVCVQRRLSSLEENVRGAMRQLCVQLSSRFDALTALLELARDHHAQKALLLLEAVRSCRGVSSPEELARAEAVFSEALEHVYAAAEEHPELKADAGYARGMSAVDSYEKMVRTSRLIYNDGVSRLNRELCRFPTHLVAGLLGFHPWAYLETPDEAQSSRANQNVS